MLFRYISINLLIPYLAGIGIAALFLRSISTDPFYMVAVLFFISAFVGAAAVSSKRPYLIKAGKLDNVRHAVMLLIMPVLIAMMHVSAYTGESDQPIQHFGGDLLGKSYDALPPAAALSRDGQFFEYTDDEYTTVRIFVNDNAIISRVDNRFLVSSKSDKADIRHAVEEEIIALYGRDKWLKDLSRWYDGVATLQVIQTAQSDPYVTVSVRLLDTQ